MDLADRAAPFTSTNLRKDRLRMRIQVCSSVLIVVLSATQVFGPGTLWAMEERGARLDESHQVVIAAIDGASLMVQKGNETKAGQFREVVNVGERLVTDSRTMAEVLIGTRAVVMLGPGTTAQLLTVSGEQTTIQVSQGLVRVAAAPSRLGPQGVVTVQTPTSQVQTRGGIVHVQVGATEAKAESLPAREGKAYGVSSLPERIAAVTRSSSELIQVDEGTAEILESGGKPVVLQAGHRLVLQAGKAGVVGEGVKPKAMRPGIVATQGHSQTPKEGREYLVSLQVDQATKLGQAITGAAETAGQGESDKKSDTKNVINGATGGVGFPNLVSALFGTGGVVSSAASNPLNTTGTGYGGHNNNGPFSVSQGVAPVGLNNLNSLLVFTRKDPVMSVVNLGTDTTGNPKKTTIPEGRFGGDGPGGTEIRYSLRTTDPNDPTSVVTATYIDGQECRGNCLASFYYDTYKTDSANGSVKYDSNKPFPDRVRFEPLLKDLNSTDPLKVFVLRKDLSHDQSGNVKFEDGIVSNFAVEKEVLLIGGSPNEGHAGVPPNQQLIVRGEDRILSINASNRSPAQLGGLGDNAFNPTPPAMASANSTFVVEKTPVSASNPNATFGSSLFGGTLGQYTSDPAFTGDNPGLVVLNPANAGTVSAVDGAITATGSNVVLTGGVTLDQGTIATIGTTAATDAYFKDLTTNLGRTFSGSLLSVIDGPNGRTSLTMQDRMLGVYDGSSIDIGKDPTDSTKLLNVALLSVLDAKLKGPSGSIPLIDIAAGTHFDRDGKPTPEKNAPNVTVTSALVTRSTVSLDGALLEASTPLFALTKANMSTTSHFADLAGNASQSMNLNGALVALSAADLVVKGNLLNLSSATAAITGYLFSLNNGSTLNISGGSLFNLDNSALALTGNAFGVFGTGTNTLTIQNNLCGSGAACGTLVNSANQPILHEGVPLKVAGVTQNVVLPNGFNAFALAPGATATNANIDISPNSALFQVDPTSTLTINGTKVK